METDAAETSNSVLTCTTVSSLLSDAEIDAAPSSSSDANKADTGIENKIPEDPISSTSDVDKSNLLENELISNSSKKLFAKMDIDSDSELFASDCNLSRIPAEKITENVDDLVLDLENLLGESTDDFLNKDRKNRETKISLDHDVECIKQKTDLDTSKNLDTKLSDELKTNEVVCQTSDILNENILNTVDFKDKTDVDILTDASKSCIKDESTSNENLSSCEVRTETIPEVKLELVDIRKEELVSKKDETSNIDEIEESTTIEVAGQKDDSTIIKVAAQEQNEGSNQIDEVKLLSDVLETKEEKIVDVIEDKQDESEVLIETKTGNLELGPSTKTTEMCKDEEPMETELHQENINTKLVTAEEKKLEEKEVKSVEEVQSDDVEMQPVEDVIKPVEEQTGLVEEVAKETKLVEVTQQVDEEMSLLDDEMKSVDEELKSGEEEIKLGVKPVEETINLIEEVKPVEEEIKPVEEVKVDEEMVKEEIKLVSEEVKPIDETAQGTYEKTQAVDEEMELDKNDEIMSIEEIELNVETIKVTQEETQPVDEEKEFKEDNDQKEVDESQSVEEQMQLVDDEIKSAEQEIEMMKENIETTRKLVKEEIHTSKTVEEEIESTKSSEENVQSGDDDENNKMTKEDEISHQSTQEATPGDEKLTFDENIEQVEEVKKPLEKQEDDEAVEEIKEPAIEGIKNAEPIQVETLIEKKEASVETLLKDTKQGETGQRKSLEEELVEEQLCKETVLETKEASENIEAKVEIKETIEEESEETKEEIKETEEEIKETEEEIKETEEEIEETKEEIKETKEEIEEAKLEVQKADEEIKEAVIDEAKEQVVEEMKLTDERIKPDEAVIKQDEPIEVEMEPTEESVKPIGKEINPNVDETKAMEVVASIEEGKMSTDELMSVEEPIITKEKITLEGIKPSEQVSNEFENTSDDQHEEKQDVIVKEAHAESSGVSKLMDQIEENKDEVEDMTCIQSTSAENIVTTQPIGKVTFEEMEVDESEETNKTTVQQDDVFEEKEDASSIKINEVEIEEITDKTEETTLESTSQDATGDITFEEKISEPIEKADIEEEIISNEMCSDGKVITFEEKTSEKQKESLEISNVPEHTASDNSAETTISAMADTHKPNEISVKNEDLNVVKQVVAPSEDAGQEMKINQLDESEIKNMQSEIVDTPELVHPTKIDEVVMVETKEISTEAEVELTQTEEKKIADKINPVDSTEPVVSVDMTPETKKEKSDAAESMDVQGTDNMSEIIAQKTAGKDDVMKSTIVETKNEVELVDSKISDDTTKDVSAGSINVANKPDVQVHFTPKDSEMEVENAIDTSASLATMETPSVILNEPAKLITSEDVLMVSSPAVVNTLEEDSEKISITTVKSSSTTLVTETENQPTCARVGTETALQEEKILVEKSDNLDLRKSIDEGTRVEDATKTDIVHDKMTVDERSNEEIIIEEKSKTDTIEKKIAAEEKSCSKEVVDKQLEENLKSASTSHILDHAKEQSVFDKTETVASITDNFDAKMAKLYKKEFPVASTIDSENVKMTLVEPMTIKLRKKEEKVAITIADEKMIDENSCVNTVLEMQKSDGVVEEIQAEEKVSIKEARIKQKKDKEQIPSTSDNLIIKKALKRLPMKNKNLKQQDNEEKTVSTSKKLKIEHVILKKEERKSEIETEAFSDEAIVKAGSDVGEKQEAEEDVLLKAAFEASTAADEEEELMKAALSASQTESKSIAEEVAFVEPTQVIDDSDLLKAAEEVVQRSNQEKALILAAKESTEDIIKVKKVPKENHEYQKPLNILVDNIQNSHIPEVSIVKEAESTTEDVYMSNKEISSDDDKQAEYSSKISKSQELKLTITKNKTDDSILKIYDPKDPKVLEISPSESETESEERPIPKLIIKQSQGSPKLMLSPLKITIKPVLKPEEIIAQKGSPKLVIKPIVKPEEEIKYAEEKHHSPKITIKPIPKPLEDSERSHSPKIIIKPIIKPTETSISPKIKIKPLVKPDEVKEDVPDVEEKERIVLKINKNNMPQQKETKKAEVGKIKLKISRERRRAHIINEPEEPEKSNTKRRNNSPMSVESKKSKIEPPVQIDDQPIEISDSEDLVVPIREEPVFIQEEPPITPTPKKRGRPRKNPIQVREDFDSTPKRKKKSKEVITPVEEVPVVIPETPTESGRPKRSCRGPSVLTMGIKPRKPRGAGRARGGGRRGRNTGVSHDELHAVTHAETPETEESHEAVQSGRIEKPTRKERISQSKLKLIKEAAITAHVAATLEKQDAEMKQVDNVIVIEDSDEVKDKDIIIIEDKDDSIEGKPSDVDMYEEETRMSAEVGNSRAQTPKQLIVSDVVEESQSSMQSTATTESAKLKRTSRVGNQETEIEMSAETLAEYYWAGEGPFMLQEQVAQYLGIKSFKRKYPNLARRSVEMQERDFIRETGLAPEHLCNLGLTAVHSADVLDIMYTDFHPKYEEYCRYQRERQAKELANKQKAAAMQEKQIIMQQAVESASQWNSTFNKQRKEDRRACMDLQTFTINYPKSKIPQVYKPKVGNYPLALVPGQYTDYFKNFTPTELNNLPLNTMLYHNINHHNSDDDTSGSESDSSSSGSDTSDSDSSEEDCNICSSGAVGKKTVA